MDFELSKNANIADKTSNVTFMLNFDDKDDLQKYITKEAMEQAFGSNRLFQRVKEQDGWYFEGPTNSVIGVSFNDGIAKLRGKNLYRRTDVTSKEVVEMFVDQIMRSIGVSFHEDRHLIYFRAKQSKA